MAEDDGTGRPVYGPPVPLGAFGLIPFAGVAMGAAAAAQLVTEAESMSSFKKEIDRLLVELEGSEAAPDKVTADRLEQSHLGNDSFRESAYLYGIYSMVHDELEKLSKILALQVDGLSIAVAASQVGYENIDYDIKQRMLKLADQTTVPSEQAQTGARQPAGGDAAQPTDGMGAI